MKNRALTAAVLAATSAVALLATPRPASALRIGVYGTTGSGSAEWQYSERGRGDVDRDTAHAGYGIVFDAGSHRAFSNYRLSLGWERIDHATVYGEPKGTLEGVVIDQDLMFNFGRRPGALRVWVGPEFRIAFLNSSDTRLTGGKEDFLSLGVGPVVGFDFALNPAMAISWKLGYLASGRAGDGTDGSSFSEGHGYATFSILFNTWGGYEEERPVERRPHIERRERYPDR